MDIDYTPRHEQPFSLAQAILFDVSVITEEISRLQNSLKHLRAAQMLLREYVPTLPQPDPVINEAIEENEDVIGSQTERISMLRLALTHKGVSISDHYSDEETQQQQSDIIPEPAVSDDGVYL